MASEFEDARVLVSDFDGTIALTSEKSPGGIGVLEVHEMVIDDLFDISVLNKYLTQGGLRNRSPRELVADLIPDADGDGLEVLTTMFVSRKIELLLGEIGTRFADGSVWPRPTAGYFDLRESLDAEKDEIGPVDEIILSAGHEPVIEATYRAWGVDTPNHVIAYETIQRLALSLPPEQLMKPSPLLMSISFEKWRSIYPELPIDDTFEEHRDRMIYVGDDAFRDGEMALNAGVSFVLFDSTTERSSRKSWGSVAIKLGIMRQEPAL